MSVPDDPAQAAFGGGSWLLGLPDPVRLLTPERLTDEHRLIAQTAAGFAVDEVGPVASRLDNRDWTLARQLLRRCGELGLLGVDVPEAEGGVRVDTIASMLVSERLSASPSFGVTFGSQVNLTVLPLLLFGTEAQKRHYLPRLLTGELVGAYCLTEPGSGSDALSARTRAVRQPDGSFVLSGEKAWITNGGIADLFVVFAKVDGEHFSAFLVERQFPGVASGREETKMGLHGSSTTPVVFDGVRVPPGNLLGETGKGHTIAFSVLNLARLKLGATCVGAAADAVAESARYAAARRQFGRPIASFGAIRHKIGEMVVRAYAVESVNYRIAGWIDGSIDRRMLDGFDAAAALAAFEAAAVEASISKVAGSEMLDFVLDENIQIHGGNGYGGDYPAERHYRDARVNRIFEGTNEINRLLITGQLARRAAAGRLRLADGAPAGAEAPGPPTAGSPVSGRLASEAAVVTRARQAAGAVLRKAIDACGERLTDEQEIAMGIADMLLNVFAADSVVLRAHAAETDRVPDADLHAHAARVFVNDAAARVSTIARQALAALADVDPARPPAAELIGEGVAVNTIALRRRIADEAVRRQRYPFY